MNRLLPALRDTPCRPAADDDTRDGGPFTAAFAAQLLGQIGAPLDLFRAARAHDAYRRANGAAVRPRAGGRGA